MSVDMPEPHPNQVEGYFCRDGSGWRLNENHCTDHFNAFYHRSSPNTFVYMATPLHWESLSRQSRSEHLSDIVSDISRIERRSQYAVYVEMMVVGLYPESRAFLLPVLS